MRRPVEATQPGTTEVDLHCQVQCIDLAFPPTSNGPLQLLASFDKILCWSSIRLCCTECWHFIVEAMTSKWALALALALSFVCAALALRAELQLEEPREILRTDGGRVELGPTSRRGIRWNPYRILLGGSSNVRRVRRGDIVAVPRGVSFWCYNSGNRDLRVLGLADTSTSLSAGKPRGFFLIGGGRKGGEEEKGQQYTGILHGFRREFLAEAWDVDERQVDDFLNRQQGAGIVLAEREIRIPESFNAVEGGQRDSASQAHFREHIHGDFVYNIREGSPEVRVRDAGIFNSANRFKLPILRNFNLGATFGRLESWNVNGHAILLVLEGNGELEIAGNHGESLVSQEVNEGDAYAVPRFYPHGIRAGHKGLEWVAFHTTDQPLVEALAGRTSAYKKLPEEVAAAEK